MIDVVLYDLDGGYCPPNLDAPVGGSEVELHQLARMLREAGLSVELVLGRFASPHHIECRTMIFWRQVEPTPWCNFKRAIIRSTDALGEGLVQPHMTVCVSKWQAARFGSQTIVIPPALGDHVYSTPKPRVYFRHVWVYASAANKGLKETLSAWSEKPRGKSLRVTTTGYDDPDPDTRLPARVTWLGRLTPLEMVTEMASCTGMFYRNAAPETFGVTTAIAVALGLELDIKCVGHDTCGLAESRIPQDLTEKTMVKRWLEILS